MDWPAECGRILNELDGYVAGARPTLCGLSACVDATVSLHDAVALFTAPRGTAAGDFGTMLAERAGAGIGGEIRIDWPDGPAWLDRNVPIERALGGTGPHAARLLTVLGAPALLALATRSPEMLAVLDPRLPLAQDGRAVAAQSIRPDRPNATKIYIFEYTKGRAVGNRVAPRSSRIIVRFADGELEIDPQFEALSRAWAPGAGAAVVAGFSVLTEAALPAGIAYARGLAERWRAAGLATLHLELSGFDRPEYRDAVLRELRGPLTSLGASLSEFEALAAGPDLAASMCAVGDRLDLRRVCVHADGWAATATRDDPERERDALLMGNVLAAARAEHARPVVPRAIPAGATFAPLPALPNKHGPWHIVACAAPYLDHPAATVGLGDTFTAGCLLVLGGRYDSRKPSLPTRISRERNTV